MYVRVVSMIINITAEKYFPKYFSATDVTNNILRRLGKHNGKEKESSEEEEIFAQEASIVPLLPEKRPGPARPGVFPC